MIIPVRILSLKQSLHVVFIVFIQDVQLTLGTSTGVYAHTHPVMNVHTQHTCACYAYRHFVLQNILIC